MFVNIFVISLITLFTLCTCDNVTYVRMERNKGVFQERQHRLFTFNTDDDGAVSVELAFNIPFLKIPVKKSLDTMTGSLANINLGAVILSGIVILGAVLAIPAIHYFITNQTVKTTPTDSYYYRSNDVSPYFWNMMYNFKRSLSDNNIDSTSCMQRMACWLVKNSSMKMMKGTATSRDKIVDGVATNEWFNLLIDNTMFDEAVRNGLNGVNCSKLYSNCKVTQRNVQMFAKQFVSAIK